MAVAFLSLGSNIEPEDNLRLAVRELERRFGTLELSPVYRSPPVGFSGDDFLNLVAMLETDESPERIEQTLEEIHALAGRQRGAERYVARRLDIDLLLYDRQVCDGPEITLPRSDVLEYAFVLKPLVDIAPDYRHPVTDRPLAEHWREFDRRGQRLTLERVIL